MTQERPEPRAFAAPWQAQAFALTLLLHDEGLFTWAEWTERLGAEIAKSDGTAAPSEDAYYARWLAALEEIAVARGAASRAELLARKDAWARAAAETPHGEPVVLR